MFPWKSVIEVQPNCSSPVYVQIANAIIKEIRAGRVQPGAPLPGTRALSELINVHRKTIVAAYDELDAQGWIEIYPSKGAFVHTTLPEKKPRRIANTDTVAYGFPALQTGYPLEDYDNIHDPSYAPLQVLGLHDGPDMRLVPTALISRTYKSIFTRRAILPHLRYNEVEGNASLRTELSNLLNESRGLQTSPGQIFVTRGSQNAIFLTCMALLNEGDLVLSGDPGYYYAERTFTHFGARIVRVPVDENGLQTEFVEKICHKRKVRMLYVTPHHHYPTTVMLSAARRMELLALAEKFGFAILEDDYDYDFHYDSSPLLPLASADKHGMVIYVGSFSKTIAPALRVGFIAAPGNLLYQIGKMRQIIDTQGDYVMEQTIAELIKLGEIKRHMKKVVKIYKQRRDHFCEQLNSLGDLVQFSVPEGGMAVWARFDPKLPLPAFSAQCRSLGLVISSGLINDQVSSKPLNAARLGFAFVNEAEASKAISIMKQVISNFQTSGYRGIE
jgi:GntR family transcriptional regulator/MocR family aminotransferase